MRSSYHLPNFLWSIPHTFFRNSVHFISIAYTLGQWRSYWGCKKGQSATPDSEKIAKIGKKRGKSGKIGKKEEKLGRKGKNREGSFTFPLLTDTTGMIRLHLKTRVFLLNIFPQHRGHLVKRKRMINPWELEYYFPFFIQKYKFGNIWRQKVNVVIHSRHRILYKHSHWFNPS